MSNLLLPDTFNEKESETETDRESVRSHILDW